MFAFRRFRRLFNCCNSKKAIPGEEAVSLIRFRVLQSNNDSSKKNRGNYYKLLKMVTEQKRQNIHQFQNFFSDDEIFVQ